MSSGSFAKSLFTGCRSVSLAPDLKLRQAAYRVRQIFHLERDVHESEPTIVLIGDRIVRWSEAKSLPAYCESWEKSMWSSSISLAPLYSSVPRKREKRAPKSSWFVGDSILTRRRSEGATILVKQCTPSMRLSRC